MNEDNDIYVVCGRCMVKISGPTQAVVNTAFRGHEKEAHDYMTGQEWYERFEEEIYKFGLLPPEKRYLMSDLDSEKVMEAARKAAGLEPSND